MTIYCENIQCDYWNDGECCADTLYINESGECETAEIIYPEKDYEGNIIDDEIIDDAGSDVTEVIP